MGLGSLFGNLAKSFLTGGTGAAEQPSTIQRTEAKSNPTTPLEQVNAAVRETSQQELKELNAPEPAPSAAAIMPEVPLGNQAEPLKAINQEEIKPAIKLEISQETVKTFEPMLLTAIKFLKEILPFFAAGIKTILPKSEVNQISSNIIKNNGGPEKAMQWLEAHVKNNPILARANTLNPTANPA
ncbi:MAG: hypothetical protein ACKO3R_10060 [bacterium]